MMLSGYTDMTIPPASVLSNYVYDDEDYITDPDKVRDVLPQPYRLLNKIVDFTFDIAWDEITKREDERIAAGLLEKPEKFECQVHVNLENVRVMTPSVDGKYTFIGTTNGVAAVDSLTGAVIDQYKEDLMVVASMTSSVLDECVHVVTIIDVQGIAKLFVFNGESVILGKIINEHDGSGPLVNKVFVSKETDFIAASMYTEQTGEFWVEFHKVPKDVWIKELATISTVKEKLPGQHQKSSEEPVFTTETVESGNATPDVHEDAPQPQAQEPAESSLSQESKSNFRFSTTNVILKVKAPGPLKPSNATHPFNAFKVIDTSADVVSTGANHILSPSHLEGRDTVFKSHRKELISYSCVEEQEKPEPHVHFIPATRFLPAGFDTGKPTTAIIWWQKRNQLMVYSLVKQAKDVNYKPEQVWPLPQTITSSATSSCGQVLAVGLANGSLITWDLSCSLQRRVHSVSPGCPIVQLDFMNPAVCPQEQMFHSHLPYKTQTSSYVLALSEDGQLSYCDTTMSLPSTATGSKSKQVVAPNPKMYIESFELLAGIPNLILAKYTDGSIYLMNALRGKFVCQIVTPDTHPLCDDVAVVSGRGQAVFCKAFEPSTDEQAPADTDNQEENIESSEEREPEVITTLFLLQCLEFDVLSTAWSKELPSTPYVLHTTLDQRLEALMQHRVGQQPIRQARLQQSWQSLASTLDAILAEKDQQHRPDTAGSRYAASTVAGSTGLPDTLRTI